MISPKWFLDDADIRFFEVELDQFVPERIYDAHMHLGHRSGYTSETHSALMASTPEVADMASYHEHVPWILPGRRRCAWGTEREALPGRRTPLRARRVPPSAHSATHRILPPFCLCQPSRPSSIR